MLGICSGCQLINVGFGGTLYQDIASDVEGATSHVNDLYDRHRHTIVFPKGSSLAGMFPKAFADPDFILQERNNGKAEPKGSEAAAALCRDLLGEAKLKSAVAESRFADVLASAVKVAKAWCRASGIKL